MTTSLPQSAAIQNDLKRIEAGEVRSVRDLSSTTLEWFVDDEELDFMTRNLARTELTIRENGIALVAVVPDGTLSQDEMLQNHNGESIDKQKKPAFVYTLGMSRLGLPEMLTFYPNPQDCHYVLNTLHKVLLDQFDQVPTTDTDVTVFDPFDNEELPVFATLLSKEEREAAFEEFTCQVESEETPVMLIHIPAPNGQQTFGYTPEKLRGFIKRLKSQA